MAKGRRLTTSRSERLLGSHSYNQGQENVYDAPELGEGDVWSMVDGMGNGEDQLRNGSHGSWSESVSSGSNGSFSSCRSHRLPPLTDNHRHVGGLSLAFEDPSKMTSSPRIRQDGSLSSPRGRQMATSAPVNVPDWSKICRVDSVESLHDSDEAADDQDTEWLPPHEYLAREHARSRKMAANSVFEGVGRTLKGRDMSRVRDAVWSQTGFNG